MKKRIVFLFTALSIQVSNAASIPDVPLIALQSAKPNLILAIDDSGSMDFEVLMPTNDGALWWDTNTTKQNYAVSGQLNFGPSLKKTVYLFPNGTGTDRRSYGDGDNAHMAVPPLPQYAYARAFAYNKAYYDPNTTYEPWAGYEGVTFGDADPINALSDPDQDGGTAAFDLTNNIEKRDTNWTFRMYDGMVIPKGTRYNSGTGWTTAVSDQLITEQKDVGISYFPATYHVVVNSGVYKLNNTTHQCASPNPDHYKTFHDNPSAFSSTDADALAYDGACLKKIEIKPTVASYAHNGSRTDCASDTYCTYNEEIQNFANWFSYYRKRYLALRAGMGHSFTGMSAMRVGLFPINDRHDVTMWDLDDSTDNKSFFDGLYILGARGGTPNRRALDHAGKQFMRTDSDAPITYECQKNFTLQFTDGFSTLNSPSVGNVDGGEGAPYADSYSNTLGDIAMKYYTTNLRTDLTAGKVPTPVGCSHSPVAPFLDCNANLHMNTFTVGLLGGTGTVFGNTHHEVTDAYTSSPTWPNVNSARDPRQIDDLYHAAVNGRGEMFSTDTPKALQRELARALTAIQAQIGSASSVTVNSTAIANDTRVFQALFNSADWSGDLIAYPVTSSGVGTTPDWRASEQLPAHGNRKIFVTTGGTAKEFKWSNLSTVDQNHLESSDVVEYLRGDQSKEVAHNGSFRNRGANVLADIVHSSPAYSEEIDTVFVGANDGMLHAFSDAEGTGGGVELFAYIPSSVIPRLKNLTESTYSHEHFVDGDIAVSTRVQTPNTNYLVALLGRGGKGLFALDVTSPENFDTNDLLWEYFDNSDSDLGNMLGRPMITKTNDGSTVVIVSNGYNSASGDAVLYIIKLNDGTVLKKLSVGVTGDNGLAAPTILDTDQDGDADYVYAGDLKGNVWKFDLTDTSSSNWNTTKLFQAEDPNGNTQPITGPVHVAYNTLPSSINYGKLFVFVGTGSYIFASDPADTQVQTWYALIDDGSTISGRSDLKQRGLSSSGTVSGTNVRTFDQASSGDMAGMKGWYIDLPAGERMVTGSVIYNLIVPVLVGSSIIPEADPCSAGGSGFVNLIDPFTGGSVSEIIVDINTDDEFDDSDKLGNEIVGSVDPDIGMPGAPVLVGNRLIVGGSTGQIASFNVNLGSSTIGRLMWREIITQ